MQTYEGRETLIELKPDCIRDILIAIRDCPESGQLVFSSFDEMRELLDLEQYSAVEIEYHARECDMEGLLTGTVFGCSGDFLVSGITPMAHRFLDAAKRPGVWPRFKARSLKGGEKMVDTLFGIAQSIAVDAISTQFGLR